MSQRQGSLRKVDALEPELAQTLARWLILSPPIWSASEEISNRLVELWGKAHEEAEFWTEIPDLPRLGKLAEELMARFIELSPELELLKKGWAIRDDGRTLGEIDFLVMTPQGPEHWELAVKFYLLEPTSGLFIGPNGRDRLDLKLERMKTHQLPLGTHPQVREWCERKGLGLPSSHPVVKGRLYGPTESSLRSLVGSQQLSNCFAKGSWVFGDDLEKYLKSWLDEPKSFLPLSRRSWLSSKFQDLQNWNDPEKPLPDKAWQGVLLEDGKEEQRLFVVPDGWPKLSQD